VSELLSGWLHACTYGLMGSHHKQSLAQQTDRTGWLASTRHDKSSYTERGVVLAGRSLQVDGFCFSISLCHPPQPSKYSLRFAAYKLRAQRWLDLRLYSRNSRRLRSTDRSTPSRLCWEFLFTSLWKSSIAILLVSSIPPPLHTKQTV
jgi:hypothetical protein